jgi:hypothetical protein
MRHSGVLEIAIGEQIGCHDSLYSGSTSRLNGGAHRCAGDQQRLDRLLTTTYSLSRFTARFHHAAPFRAKPPA